MESNKNGTTIQSLQVGLSIVDLVAKQGRPLRFADIHELTNITKSNLYKYLNTLTQMGILYREKESGTYVLGSKLIEYGMAAMDQEKVLERIMPYLQEISQKSANTVLYSVWTQHGPMIVWIVNSTQGIINIGAKIGSLLPIQSATGKIFAAFMDEPVIRDWKENEIKKLPPEKRLLVQEETHLIREREIAFAREPLVPSVSSVALPILNYQKRLLGAITIVGFNENIPQSEQDELSKFLVEMKKEICGSFGYHPVHNR